MIWNPSETMLNLAVYQLRYYTLMFIIAFSLGWFIMKKIFINENKSVNKLESLLLYTGLATIIGARLGHVFFYDWDYFKNHLLEILLPVRFEPHFQIVGFSGLASHGAAIGIIISMYLFIRKYPEFSLSWILDRIVIPVSIAGFFIRLGNLMNSEILGKITESTNIFAFKFVRGGDISAREALKITGETNVSSAFDAIGSDPRFSAILEQIPYRHPVQLYEAVGYFCIFWILWWVYWKTNKKQQPYFIFGLFLVLLWSVRFLAEFFKDSQGGFENVLGILSTGQWLSIPFIISGLFLLVYGYHFTKKSN